MAKRLFRVYVDEAGDRGWGGRSTPTFVLSAVIVRDEERDGLRATLDGINRDLGKPPSTVLHWAENVKQHSQRKHAARQLAATPATISNVVVLKEAMIGSGTALSDASTMYNYAIRRLLERVSWFVDERGGEDDFGDFEPAYLMELVPRIYKRGQAHVTSYGMNIIGPKEYMAQTYPWWGDFVAACSNQVTA